MPLFTTLHTQPLFMLENISDKTLAIMDRIFEFEYDHCHKKKYGGPADHYIVEQLGIGRLDVENAHRHMAKYLYELGLCKISVYPSGDYSYLKFYEEECEGFIKNGGFTGKARQLKERQTSVSPHVSISGTMHGNIIGGNVSHSPLSTHSPTVPTNTPSNPTKMTTWQIVKRVSVVITIIGTIVAIVVGIIASLKP